MVNKTVSALEARRAYFREWRKNNPEKIKKHNQNYWAKVAERMAAEAAKNGDGDK